jgi:hypothetical protein
MAYWKGIKTNGMGKGKRRWMTRYEVKQAAKRIRRLEDKAEVSKG